MPPARPERAAREAGADVRAPRPACRLYLVTPERFETRIFAAALGHALDGGDVASVQLRMKDAARDAIARAAEVLMPVCHARGAAFLLNDDPALALALGADGVHVGQSDAACAEARRILGADRIVGVTCHDSRDLAVEAAAAGADYVAFGAFFPTATKAAKSLADPDILRWWSAIATVPAVAIGGITVENCETLVEAGADFLAVVAGVWDRSGGPGAAVAAFNDAITRGLARRAGEIAQA